MIREITVFELEKKIKENQDFILLDVRNIQEIIHSKIDSSIHIPMNDIPNRIGELNPKKEIVVQCKSGKRSLKVCKYLAHNDFKNIKNLEGGILAWAKLIDTSMQVF